MKGGARIACRVAATLRVRLAQAEFGRGARAAAGARGCGLVCGFLLAHAGLVLGLPAQALDPRPAFEAANKLYEQKHYAEAATAYASMVRGGMSSPAVYLNLGNAWFKAGKKGRAVAAYRMGLTLAPRDPSLRFNLRFVRETVNGQQTAAGTWWKRWLASLTVNEWTVLFAGAFWLWFFLLALRELREDWRRALRGYTLSAGMAALLLLGCLIHTLHQRTGLLSAVVVTPEAVVRYGPLEDSQVYFQLQDGMEVTVLDEKQGEQFWLLIEDASGRQGWLRRGEVTVLPPTPPDAH